MTRWGANPLTFSTRISRRTLVGLCTAGLAAGIITAPPASAKEKSDQTVAPTLQTIVGGGLVGFDTKTGQTLELSPLNVVNNLVDVATSNVIGKGSMRFSISDGPAGDLRSCIKSGKRHGLTAYSPINRTLTGNDGVLNYQYHPYRLANARRIDGGLSTQWEVCAKGGGQFAGDRLRQVGTGIALNNAAPEPRRIGYSWQTGNTPENYSLELGFEVEKGPISIGASITQNPADKLLGGFRPPMRTDVLEAHQVDAVNAWWQDNCIGRWWKCWRNSGSHDFQGTVSHGLWEFRARNEPAIVSFYLIPYASF